MRSGQKKCGNKRNRPPLPRIWLFTDERIATERLLDAVRGLPTGSGIVFRHYDMAQQERRRLFDAVRAIARQRRLVLLLAGTPEDASAWQADGVHISGSRRRSLGIGRAELLRSASAHDARDMIAARRGKVELLFLSPVFPTRSHPGGRVLGRLRFGSLAQGSGQPVIALGGMTARRFESLRRLGAWGWAAIDAHMR